MYILISYLSAMYVCNQNMTNYLLQKFINMDIISNDKGLEKEFETAILCGTQITTYNQNHALNTDLLWEIW